MLSNLIGRMKIRQNSWKWYITTWAYGKILEGDNGITKLVEHARGTESHEWVEHNGPIISNLRELDCWPVPEVANCVVVKTWPHCRSLQSLHNMPNVMSSLWLSVKKPYTNLLLQLDGSHCSLILCYIHLLCLCSSLFCVIPISSSLHLFNSHCGRINMIKHICSSPYGIFLKGVFHMGEL